MNQLKKKYKLKQMYIIILRAYRSIPSLFKNRIKKIVDPMLIERLMLATTEVNGCDVCSYAHTKMALMEGFKQEEIDAFLSGSAAYVHEHEAKAIFYAQHVADTMGEPDPDATRVLLENYGVQASKIMRAGINMMMMGNVSGITLSALLRRMKGNPYQNSTLLYELGMLAVQPLVFAFALIHAVLDVLILKRYGL